MVIIAIPCLSDNYAYLLVCPVTGTTAVVDPSQAAPVQAALEARGARLSAILNTHHHHDHVGGNLALLDQVPGIPVYGHVSDQGRIPGLTHGLEDTQTFTVGALTVRALHVPGHTTGALAYQVADAVFTGDTLFLGGCGRLFEGTPGMMYTSLNRTLGALRDSTRVYCGHEYTVKNLLFASHLEPHNPAIATALADARTQREHGVPTVPGTLARERETNPFLRCDNAAVQSAVGGAVGVNRDLVAVFAAVRAAKDTF